MAEPRSTARPADKHVVEVLPENRRVLAGSGESVLSVLHEAGVSIESTCGGRGMCGECRIRYIVDPPEPSEADRQALDGNALRDGWRLACEHRVEGDIRFELRPSDGELDHKARSASQLDVANLDPLIRRRSVRWRGEDRADARPLSERLVVPGRESLRFSNVALQHVARVPNDAAQVFLDSDGERILRVSAAGSSDLYGVAIDVGTTTLAVHLFDLVSGERIGAAAARNPQRRIGADVISRIAHIRRDGRNGLEQLHRAVIGGLNELIQELAEGAGVASESILGATVVGNPTMLHLLAAVSPVGIDVSPYVPIFTASIRCRADEIGLAIERDSLVVLLPSISAYVGADIVGGILATGLRERNGVTLFLDVGTNGEVVLARDGALTVCSTAAGPAFEGASIACGMAALGGAIEDVALREDRVDCSIIGGGTARGLCGTGLVSAVAELRTADLLDASGRLVASTHPLSKRLSGQGKERRFRLTEGNEAVDLFQSDIREFQLAKAAIRAGIEILLRRSETTADQIDRVLIGGAFSKRLRATHLIRTGLLPGVDVERIEVVGNTAGQGAALALLDRAYLDEAIRVSASVQYVELSSDSEFSDRYVEALPFPEEDEAPRGESVGKT